MKLSGSFAELRSNHFHAGIDIKSENGQGGDPVFASEQGHISRVKIQSGGYGRAIYMDHPNGYTTVYAHLDRFHSEIEEFVNKVQKEVEQFEVDIYLPLDKFSFKKGQQIGVLGNTGRSSAPHLHFEIRETKTERPVIPSRFNIKVSDNIPPIIKELYVYELDEDGNPLDKIKVSLSGSNGNYKSSPSDILVHTDKVGIGVVSYDRSDGAWNKNGIYSTEVRKQDSVYFKSRFDKIDFSESKAINGIIDYPHYKKYKSRILKLFGSECIPLSNYHETSNNGWLDVKQNEKSTYQVAISDNAGNISRFDISMTKIQDKSYDKTIHYLVQCGQEDTIQLTSGTRLIFFEKSFYRDQNIKVTEEKVGEEYQIKITNDDGPAHQFYRLDIPGYRAEDYILLKKVGDRLTNFGGQPSESGFQIYLDEFGTYIMGKDDVPPRLSKTATTTKHGSKQYIFTIGDNIDHDGSLGDFGIRVSGCNEWVPYLFDAKSDQIIVDKRHIPSGCTEIQITIMDHSGNTTDKVYPI